jgi:nucleoside-diphosphate-sugar epimerase
VGNAEGYYAVGFALQVKSSLITLMQTYETIITGGTGFIDSNAASRYLRRGHQVVIVDNLCRPGVQKNLEWLRTQGSLEFVRLDVREADKTAKLFRDHRDANQALHFEGPGGRHYVGPPRAKISR